MAVEPKESPCLSAPDAPIGPHKIQGIGAGFVPSILDKSVIDEYMPIHSDDAMSMARDLATKEGLLVGISSGAAVQAALQVKKIYETQIFKYFIEISNYQTFLSLFFYRINFRLLAVPKIKEKGSCRRGICKNSGFSMCYNYYQ